MCAGARRRRQAPGAHDHGVPPRPARPLARAHRPAGEDRRRRRSLEGRGMEYNNASRELVLRATRDCAFRERRRRMKRALALACASAFAAWAEKADRDKPTQVEANRMSADDARRLNVFEGDVVVTKGTMRLTADRLVVRQDAEGFQSPPRPASRRASASARMPSPARRKASGWKARRCASSSTTASRRSSCSKRRA